MGERRRRADPVRMLAVSFAHLRDTPPSEDVYLQTAGWRLVFEHGGRRMHVKAELARAAQKPLTPVEAAATELAQVIRENTEGQKFGETSREQLLAGRAQELGQKLLELVDEAAHRESA